MEEHLRGHSGGASGGQGQQRRSQFLEAITSRDGKCDGIRSHTIAGNLRKLYLVAVLLGDAEGHRSQIENSLH